LFNLAGIAELYLILNDNPGFILRHVAVING